MGAAVLPLAIAGSNIAEGLLSFAGQRSANVANAAMAAQQMNFQERMSNTSYQRAVEDMKKAGLNPALAYQQGGASSPAGASAQIGNALASMKGTAQGAAATYATIANTKADLAQKQANTDYTKAQTNQLQLESTERLNQLIYGNQLTATNARFAQQSFDPRLMNLWQQNVLADTQIKRTNLDYQIADKFKEQLTAAQLQQARNTLDLFPLTKELTRTQIANTLANARDTAAHAALSELARPGAENIARSERTAFGRNVRPYLNDAKTITDVVNKNAGMLSELIPAGSLTRILMRQMGKR